MSCARATELIFKYGCWKESTVTMSKNSNKKVIAVNKNLNTWNKRIEDRNSKAPGNSRWETTGSYFGNTDHAIIPNKKNTNGDNNKDRDIYHFKEADAIWRPLHIIYTVNEEEPVTSTDWLEPYGEIVKTAFHSGCNKGQLHGHILIHSMVNKDQRLFYNYLKLFRSYFTIHGDIDCSNCEKLAQYGRSSKCSTDGCPYSISIREINDEDHYENLLT